MMIKNKIHKYTEDSSTGYPSMQLIIYSGNSNNFDFSNRGKNLKLPNPSSTHPEDSYSLDELKKNKKKLSDFRNLKTNWDGENGKPISPSVISKTEKLIAQLRFQPQIFPTGRGTLQIEYFKNEHNCIEIEIFEDSQFMCKVEDGIEEEREIDINDIIALNISFRC